MSFCEYKKTISEGDTVLIYLSPKQMYPVKILNGEVFQTRFGAIRLDQLIGQRYGCKIQCSKGFVHILDMTPELWTLTLPHRTQILYGPDISLILLHLQLKAGSLVVEAGTGSGSLSHSIARTIAPWGRLFTFDFHEERVQTARKEFQEHGLGDIVHIEHRDVCHDGFQSDHLNTFINDKKRKVDAVFLDLPHPWEAIHSAQRILKNGGRICCFSPCIEQVQRSCQQLSKLNFLDVETFECVLRPYEVRNVSLKKLPNYQQQKMNQSSFGDDQQPQSSSNKQDLDQIDEDSYSNNPNLDDSETDSQNETNKKSRLLGEDECGQNCKPKLTKSKHAHNEIEYWVTYMNAEVPGHTGFLTFATNFQDESFTISNNNNNQNDHQFKTEIQDSTTTNHDQSSTS